MVEPRLVFCPRCARNVRIVTTSSPLVSDGQAPVADPRDICLDYGPRCERSPTGSEEVGGARCPVFGTPVLVMGFERARAGFGDRSDPTVVVHCEGCGRDTEQRQVGSAHALCTLCGTPHALQETKR